MRLLILFLCLVFGVCSYAADGSAPTQKPGLVLLPIQGEGMSQADRDQYRGALVQKLKARYTVFSGAEVDKKLEKFAKKTCDETKCLQEMQIHYQAELIGRVVIKKVSDGYLLTIELTDVFSDKVEYSDTRPCTGCSETGLIGALKSLAAIAAGGGGGSGVAFVTSPSSSGPVSGGIERIEAKQSGDNGGDVAVLILDSEPSGAEVYLGGIKAGSTPYQNLRLQAGQTIGITLKKVEYHDKQVELTLKGGSNEASIKLAPAFGALNITSTPPGASVYLGGQEVGVTPYGTERLASGKHLLSVRLALHASVENKVIEIRDGATTSEHLTLEQRYGTLKVGGSGATIGISTPKSQKVHGGPIPAEIRLEPGTYLVELSQTGHESQKFNLTVAAKQTQTLSAEQTALRKLEGTLIISSDPYVKGAEVFVNGQSAGQIPATLKLAAGKQTIKVVAGDRGGEQEIEVIDRKTVTAALKLASLGPKFFKDCAECPEMVVIPAGSFEMGSNDGANDEKPVHRVTVKSFAIGKTEVTQGQWKALMGNNPSYFYNCGDTCPVEQVSWDDAQEYLKKLSAKTGKQYRLPSEAEWEYACRAGGKHEYCGGIDARAVAWMVSNSLRKTHPAGQKQANTFGLYDMSGNVWEWTADHWHDNYNGAPGDGSAWTIGGDAGRRVLRGGSWFDRPRLVRSATRIRNVTGARGSINGFRVALSSARTN